ERLWNQYIRESVDNDKHIKVTLLKDWIAYPDSTKGTSFGVGIGFGVDSKSIIIPQGGKITLDLNGKTIDRKLTQEKAVVYGGVIRVYGELSIMDSVYSNSYNSNINIKTVYEENKEDENLLYSKIEELNYGKIQGGASTSHGGGVCIAENAVFNMYGGVIANNMVTVNGGGIYSETATINLYDGIIYKNEATEPSKSNGAGIFLCGSTLNVYGGYIIGNSAGYYGGGIEIEDHLDNTNGNIDSVLNIYDCVIAYNKAMYGAGVSFSYYSYGYMYDGRIEYNFSTGNSAGLLVYTGSIFEMYNGKISHNYSEHKTGVTGGAGVLIANKGKMFMYNGEISYNTMASQVNVYGGGIGVSDQSALTLRGGIITQNNVVALEGYVGTSYDSGGVGVSQNCSVAVGGGVQIYNNFVKGGVSDLFVAKGNKLQIIDSLLTQNNIAHIGIDLPLDYGDTPFTQGYSSYGNKDVVPSKVFYSSSTEQGISLIEGECKIDSTTTKNTGEIKWKWQGSQSGETNLTNAQVVYSGSNYKITATNNNVDLNINRTINNGYNQLSAKYFEISEVGSYAFHTTENVANPVFTFTILPVEVDIKWSSSEFVYNGGLQKPTAYIEEDPNCKVTVVGEKIESGSGYVATAIELSNKNYKINPASIN
ncbi:MAG: hypothetical protein K2P12_05345, partial [Clostridia bacterium]|nr:hypothetical protein [Clostridia bacterium]